MAKCKFCEIFEDIERTHNQMEGFSKKYTCALISETYRGKDYKGRTTYGSMELNYCPECGRKLKNE